MTDGPLSELSTLLGLPVVGVRTLRVRIDGRAQPDANAWALLVACPEHGTRWTGHILTRRLRDSWWLNATVHQLGRDPALPALTRVDGRRALRLMHEVIEAGTAGHESPEMHE